MECRLDEAHGSGHLASGGFFERNCLGQRECEPGAIGFPASPADIAPIVPGQRPSDGETQTATPTRLAAGEERIEQVIFGARSRSGTAVFDLKLSTDFTIGYNTKIYIRMSSYNVIT